MANQLLEKPVTYEVNGEEVKLSGNIIKNYLVSGNGDVTDQEVVMFLNLCKFQRLNPFLNEAYLVKFKNKGGGMEKPAQIIVSKEAFMKRAESHPKYAGFEAGILVQREDELVEIEGAVKLPKDVLIGGWAKIYREDRQRPVKVAVDFKEFSKGQATWNNMPQNMIRKVAIVNALREAFPEYLGAMYTEDEENPADKQPPMTPKEVGEAKVKALKEKIAAREQKQAEQAQENTQKDAFEEYQQTTHKKDDKLPFDEPQQEDLFSRPSYGNREENKEHEKDDMPF